MKYIIDYEKKSSDKINNCIHYDIYHSILLVNVKFIKGIVL